MSGTFAPILITTTPGDIVQGWLSAAANKSATTEAELVERMCAGLDWARNDVYRLAEGAVEHLGQMTDEAIVKRLAGAVDTDPRALAFRTRMAADGFEMDEDEDDKRPIGFKFIMSDALPDRASDIVDQGWDLTEFRSNPIAPYNHNYWALPVGKWANVRTVNQSLRGTFMPFVPSSAAVHPMAVAVREMMEQRVLVTCSVGFRPKAVIARASLDEEDPRYGERGMVYLRNTLLECSPTPMPMNPRAARKSAVPAVEPEEVEAQQAEPPAKSLWGLAPLSPPKKSPWSK